MASLLSFNDARGWETSVMATLTKSLQSRSRIAGNDNGRDRGVRKLTRQEIIDLLERGSKQRMKMSARKLLRMHRENRLEDAGAVADLLALSYLLRKDDPIFREG